MAKNQIKRFVSKVNIVTLQEFVYTEGMHPEWFGEIEGNGIRIPETQIVTSFEDSSASLSVQLSTILTDWN